MEDFVIPNTIYEVIVGSTAYGLNTPDSDIDQKGICIPPKDMYFGLRSFEQQEFEGKDRTIYSIKKFFKMARDCNPNIIEMLFVDPKFIVFKDKFGQMLVDNREIFLSTKAKHTFSGYAFAQLKRIKGHRKWIMNEVIKPREQNFMAKKVRKLDDGTLLKYEKFQEVEYKKALSKYNQYLDWKKNRNPMRAELEQKYGYDCKHAMHLMRLLRMGKEILTTGTVNVLREDREELMAIRNGKWTYEKLISEAEKAEEELNNLYENSVLPKKTQR